MKHEHGEDVLYTCILVYTGRETCLLKSNVIGFQLDGPSSAAGRKLREERGLLGASFVLDELRREDSLPGQPQGRRLFLLLSLLDHLLQQGVTV